jgi:anti-anti-sigma factor
MTTDDHEPGQPRPFEVASADSGQWCRLTVGGDVDVDTAPRLRQAVADALVRGRRHVAVDMSHVSFLDSTGLTALLTARQDAIAAGGSLQLSGASAAVVRLLEIASLTDLVDAGGEGPTGGRPPPPT